MIEEDGEEGMIVGIVGDLLMIEKEVQEAGIEAIETRRVFWPQLKRLRGSSEER
jgi:hypothetical protein